MGSSFLTIISGTTIEVLWARLLWPTWGDGMRYEITIAESAFSGIPKPYGREAQWFLEKINYGRPPAAWAYVALPSEIDAADEVMRARDGFEEEIKFSPYTSPPDPLPS